jgi:hypothetical protein
MGAIPGRLSTGEPGAQARRTIETLGREYAQAIEVQRREHADAVAASEARHKAFKRRERILLAVVAVTAFSAGAFHESLARFIVAVTQGSVVRLALGGATLAVPAVAASMTAAMLMEEGTASFRQPRFWLTVALTVLPPLLSFYLGRHPAR